MNIMDTHKRDQGRYELLTILETEKASIPICPDNERDFIFRLMVDDAYRKVGADINKTLVDTGLTHEESIVAGVVALVRASNLPHRAIFKAVTACLDRESSVHKSHTSGHTPLKT